MAAEEKERLENAKAVTLNEGEWAVYQRSGPRHNGPWEFSEIIEAPEDPESAARVCCANHWTSGSHRFLVVGPEAFEFEITIETKEVTPDAA